MKKLLPFDAERILDSLPDCIYVINKDLRVEYINDATSRLLNIKKDALIGATCIELCKSDRCQTGCPVLEVLRTGKSVNDLRTTLMSKFGKLIPVIINASILTDEQNNGIGGIISAKKDMHISYAEHLREIGHFYGIVGVSKPMRQIYKMIEEITNSDICVLISGETGVGKEVIANAIQKTSRRHNKPFVKVNCASLRGSLLASELFGHTRGAFTDAIQKRVGRFEIADGGTIFLDEIGEMPIEMQTSLLRILQDGTFERLGESQTRKTNVRVIAATNRNLDKLIREKRFREDLYFRLNRMPIQVPALRHRKSDILLLAKYFLKKKSVRYQKFISEFSPKSKSQLQNYDWPGNVRELEHAIEYAVLRAKRDDFICDCSLPERIKSFTAGRRYPVENGNTNELKHAQMLALLEQHNWNKSKVARLLGIDRSTIRRWLKEINQNRHEQSVAL